MVASENHQVCGFIALISYKNAIIVDYLAVSSKIRSKGTGSYMLKKFSSSFLIKILFCSLNAQTILQKIENSELHAENFI